MTSGSHFTRRPSNPARKPRLTYPDYVEAVWVVDGQGELVDRDNDQTYRLAPGTMYLLDGHERHTIVAHSGLRMFCVFCPAVPPGSD